MSDEIHSDMDPFRYMVRRFIAIDSPNLIRNGSPAHARILLEEMFAHMQKTAYVYCGRISNEVWGSATLAEAVRQAFERPGTEIHFMVQHPENIPEGSLVAAILREHNAIVTSPAFSGINAHFAVFDSKMYRFEKDDGKKTATACVNAPEMASALTGLAQIMMKSAAA